MAEPVDIYILEQSGGREIRIPWLPEEIEYSSGGTLTAVYEILNRGDVEIPTGTGLRELKWSSIFPGAARTDSGQLRGVWQDPSLLHNLLEDWRENGTPLTVLVTGYPINLDVFLADYEAKAAGGFLDLEYTVRFKELRPLALWLISPSDQSPEPQRSVPETVTYTVKKGDTLWGIAKSLLGAGSRWQEIYAANQEIIESVAKDHKYKSSGNGRWIFPGTTLTIPQ